MAGTFFDKYEMRERSIAREYAPFAIEEGYVTHAEAIYSDIDKCKRLAFYRQGVPLLPLLFLYEQVVVYIPPCSKDELRIRFGIEWDVLKSLIQSALVIPIIGHPKHYATEQYLIELFNYKPASVWARGDELALEFANGREYWEYAHKLVCPEDYMSDRYIINKYKHHFQRLSLSELINRIDIEVKTNYVDLCIYGHEKLATSLLHEDCRGWGARKIIDLSERIVYPSLLGLGGTPNYGLNSVNSIKIARELKAPKTKQIGPELSILTDGLSLTLAEKFTPEIVIEFHKDAMSKKLWKALDSLEDAVIERGVPEDDLVNRAKTAIQIVNDTVRYVNAAYYQIKRNKIQKGASIATDFSIKVMPVLPIATLFWTPFEQNVADATLAGVEMAGFIAALKLQSQIADKVEDLITRALMLRTPKIANQIWWLNEWGKKH